jgi:trehalose 6-phosphate phosphatase
MLPEPAGPAATLLPPPLVGVDGAHQARPRPRRGDLQRALDRLGPCPPGALLLATDFDGTLAPIESHPDAALPLPTNLALVDRLVATGVHIAVVSGRGRHDVRRRLPVAGSTIAGDDGVAIALHEERALNRFNSRVGQVIARWPGVWLERKAGSSSIHYRGAPDAGPALAPAVLPVADRFSLIAEMGKMVIEVRPQRNGRANALLDLVGAVQPRAVVYAGDDAPDDSAFRLLRDMPRPHLAVGVCSGERPADEFGECDLVVEGPAGMAIFLRALLERVLRSRPL